LTTAFGLVYVPGPRELTVDQRRLKGPVKAAMFDPTTGERSVIRGTPLADRRKLSFTTPGKNAAGDGDFVLVLAGAL
jgi:hypothetical protein